MSLVQDITSAKAALCHRMPGVTVKSGEDDVHYTSLGVLMCEFQCSFLTNENEALKPCANHSRLLPLSNHHHPSSRKPEGETSHCNGFASGVLRHLQLHTPNEMDIKAP